VIFISLIFCGCQQLFGCNAACQENKAAAAHEGSGWLADEFGTPTAAKTPTAGGLAILLFVGICLSGFGRWRVRPTTAYVFSNASKGEINKTYNKFIFNISFMILQTI
jgi:hypothetical protein